MKEVSFGLIGVAHYSQAIGWVQAATFASAVSKMSDGYFG